MSVHGLNSVGTFNLPTDDTSSVTARTTTSTASLTLTSPLLDRPELAGVAAGTATIGMGARGEGARAIQQALIALGHDLGSWGADGSFGRTTQTQVALFQRQNGLSPTGTVDRDTLAVMDQKLSGTSGTGSTGGTSGTGGTGATGQLQNAALRGDATLRQIAAGQGTLARGARGEPVRLVQQALITAGYDLGRWGADGAFGAGTETVIAQFQRASGITPANGQIDQRTLAALDQKISGAGSTTGTGSTGGTTGGATLTSDLLRGNATLRQIAGGQGNLARGATGEAVRLAQQALINAGHNLGRAGADGQFGGGTEAQVAAFQRANGILPANGRIDQRTILALDEKGARPQPKNEIVFLGMGDHTAHEVQDLQRRGVNVLGITDSGLGDDKVKLTVNGRDQVFDLTNDQGIDGFVAGLGITGAKATEVAGIIRGAGSDGRDETAMLVKAFHEAEKGDRVTERLVLSGHSVGSGVWGDHNGFFSNDSLRAIAQAFPTAAGQVEDLLIAGCYSSSERHVELYRGIFPNMKTFWAYGDSAPGTWTGAMIHNQKWEAATRGIGSDPTLMNRGLAAGTRKGENVATWNAIDGYQGDGPSRPIAEVRQQMAGMRDTVAAFQSGAQTIADTQTGPMREYYRLVQELLGNTALPASERPGLERERDSTIRLIFYDAAVKGRFQQHYGNQIRDGFQAVGLAAPDFSQLSRAQGLAKIAEFEAAIARSSNPAQAARDLAPILTGLRNLTVDVIPNNWV